MISGRFGTLVAILAMLTLCGWPTFAIGQTNERAYESLEIRVVTPGARAVGMGKTFVGIADDATAAASNPAGLSNLLDPEFSIELSGTRFRHRRFQPTPDDPHATTEPFTQFVGFPTFASYVTPLPGALRRATLALFYNSLQRYREQFSIAAYLGDPADSSTRQDPHAGDMRINATALGIGGAYVFNPRLSIGGSMTLHSLKFDSRTWTGSKATPTDFRNGTVTDDSDRAVGGQIGVLYKPRYWLTLGAAYYPRTTFKLTTTIFGDFCPENCPVNPEQHFDGLQKPIDYRIPDRVTVGGAMRRGRWTFASDVTYIRYQERVTDNFQIIDFMLQPDSSQLKRQDYFFNNVREVHAGVEHRWIRSERAYAVRFGGFRDPDHSMRFNYYDQSRQASAEALRFNNYHPSMLGATVGGGVVWSNRLQVDGAVSLAPNLLPEVVISVVSRFPAVLKPRP